MTTEKIHQKIGRIREYLGIIDQLRSDCEKKFPKDPIYRGALLHYLYLMADTCVALAVTLVKLKSLRSPQSYHEAFDILGKADVLDPEFAYDFARIAGFRNFLAHDYEDVEAEMICRDILGSLHEVLEFLRQVEQALVK
jgi:uncharacterized protein YutE (UPF0331/DUF86 family)